MTKPWQKIQQYEQEDFLVIDTGAGVLFLDPILALSTIKPWGSGCGAIHGICQEATFINGSLHERVLFTCGAEEIIERVNGAKKIYLQNKVSETYFIKTENQEELFKGFWLSSIEREYQVCDAVESWVVFTDGDYCIQILTAGYPEELMKDYRKNKTAFFSKHKERFMIGYERYLMERDKANE